MAAGRQILVAPQALRPPKQDLQLVDAAIGPANELFGGNILGYSSNGDHSIEQITQDLQSLGVHQISFNPALFHENDLIISSHPKTPDTTTIESIALSATQTELPLAVKPIIDSQSLGGNRGTFTPRNAGEWFTSYQQAIDALYAPAYQLGSRQLIIGTELSQLEMPAYQGYWEDLIVYFDSSYPDAKISYTQNWDRLGQDPSFIASLDELSYSAYFPFSNDNTFEQQWQPIIEQILALQAETGVTRAIAEFGLALTGSVEKPYFAEDKFGQSSTQPNPNLVANYIAAACRSFNQAGLQHDMWAASYLSSEVQNGLNLDAARGFYIGAPQNSELADQINSACAGTS